LEDAEADRVVDANVDDSIGSLSRPKKRRHRRPGGRKRKGRKRRKNRKKKRRNKTKAFRSGPEDIVYGEDYDGGSYEDDDEGESDQKRAKEWETKTKVGRTWRIRYTWLMI